MQKHHCCSRFREYPGPGTERTASWETQETPDTCTASPPIHENQTDEKSSSSSDSSSSSSLSTQAQSGIPQHANTQAQTDQFQRSTAESHGGESSSSTHTDYFGRWRLRKAQLRSSSRTKRVAEPTTLDVSPQAKHPRGEGSQMDNQSMTVDGVMIAGTEDPAEYFDGHADVASPSCLMVLRLTRR